MRTIRTKVYQFSELGEPAKQKAIEWYRDGNEYIHSGEVLDTIKKGLAQFGATLKNYSIDWDNINCSYFAIDLETTDEIEELEFAIDLETTDEIEELEGVRLWKYLHNNNMLAYWNKYHKKTQNLLAGDCPFTGICFDEDFLDNIRKFVKKPDSTTFKELLTDAVYNTINAGCKDWDYINSDEGIEESIIANEYEFKADGTRF